MVLYKGRGTHLCRVSLACRLFSRPARYGEAIKAFSSGTHTSGRFFITSTSAMLKPTEDGWQTTAAVSSKNTGKNTSCSRSWEGEGHVERSRTRRTEGGKINENVRAKGKTEKNVRKI